MVSSIYSMTNITSTSSAKARNGIAGLASGIDTDSVVEQMTLGTRTKITKLQQQNTKLGWKMEAYQAVTTAMLNFQSKYMSSAAASNLSNADFFKSGTITSNGKYASAVSVSGTNSAAISSFSIKSVSSLAKTATASSKVSASSNAITSADISSIFANGGTVKSELEGETIKIKVNGQSYGLTLKDVAVDINDPENNAKNIEDAFNAAIKAAKLDEFLSAKVDSGGQIQLEVLQAVQGEEGETPEPNVAKLEYASDNVKTLLGLEAADPEAPETAGPISGSVDITNSGNAEKTYATTPLSDNLAGSTMAISLNGTSKTITFGSAAELANAGIDGGIESLVDYLNDKMAAAFGTTADGQNKVTVSADNGKLSFTTADATSILSIAAGESSGVLGLKTGAANRLLMSEAITSTNLNSAAAAMVQSEGFKNGTDAQEITVNGTKFSIYSDKIVVGEGDGAKTYEFENGTTMNNIVSTINNAGTGVKIQYNSATDNFTMTATESGSIGKIEIEGAFADAIFGEPSNRVTQAGTDAVMVASFDGGASWTEITRSSNAFSLNGMSIALNETFNEGVGVGDAATDAITFTSKANTDKIMDAIKEMVTAYNELIDLVNGYLKTKPDNNYQPLTGDQRNEMSESEITTWDKKAQEGILYGDPLMRTLANDLQYAFSMPVGGDALKSIGISASSWDSYGKLSIDEAKLREAIETDADKVAEVFAKSSSGSVTAMSTDAGVMSRMESLMTKYTNTASTSRGLLVTKAGSTTSSYATTESEIYKQMARNEDEIARWEDRLSSEQDRYYRQFTTLETYISNMNQQSSWLSSFF